jgi:hypothetical protein
MRHQYSGLAGSHELIGSLLRHCADPGATTYGGDQVKRREFITLLGGAAAAWPVVVRAQQAKRVGVLDLGNVDAQSFRTELREGLRKSGYIEGQNIEYAFRSADNNAGLSKLAAELVALKVDVLVALYTPCALAAQQATREIPTVTVSGDPVGLGLVASLARPGDVAKPEPLPGMLDVPMCSRSPLAMWPVSSRLPV